MNAPFPRWFRAAIAIALMSANSGCSFIFVSPPKTHQVSQLVTNKKAGDCTSSNVAPVLDSVFGAAQVGRTVLVVAADNEDYSDAPISREADIAFGIAFTALFVSSAVYGFANTSSCRTLRNAEENQKAFSEPEHTLAGFPHRAEPTAPFWKSGEVTTSHQDAPVAHKAAP